MAEIKPYNRKVFLAPKSITSMAAIHCKIKSCGNTQVRISDCNSTIKLWNNIHNPGEVEEMIEKITNLQNELALYKSSLIDSAGRLLYDKVDAVQS